MSSNQNLMNQINQLKNENEQYKKLTQLLLHSLFKHYGYNKKFNYKSFHYRTFLPPDIKIIAVYKAIDYPLPLEYTTEYTKNGEKLILTAEYPHAVVIYVKDKTQEVDEKDLRPTATFSSYSDDYGYKEGEKACEYVWHQF